MRLLHVVPTYLPATRYGGPIYSVHGLCSGLARRGHEVHVYTTNVDGRASLDVPIRKAVNLDGVSVTYFPTGHGRRFYRSPSMQAALDQNLGGFDIAHLHSVFLWPTSATAATARRLGVPYVMSPRGMLVPELIERQSSLLKRLWIELFERRNLAAAAAIHVTAGIEAADFQRLGLTARQFATIPNGVDIPQLSAMPVPTDVIPKPIILFLGRVTWKKGLERLIPAMAAVPNAQLVIAGNDEERYIPQLASLARHHGVAERTHFVGPLYGNEKWRVFAAADIFVLPSHSENFGIAVLEAMASGVPVIVTPETGLAQTVSQTGAGLVVEGDIEALSKAINGLLANPGERLKMGNAGRAVAISQFTWDAIAEQMETLYTSIQNHDGSEVVQAGGVYAK